MAAGYAHALVASRDGALWAQGYNDRGQLGTGGLYDPPGVGKKHAGGKLAWPAPDHLEPQLQDGNLTNHAVETIERMASGGYGEDVASGKRPFFLAVGFVRPPPPP